MRSTGTNFSVLYHKDLVAVCDGRQAVSDHDQGLALGQLCHRRLNHGFVFRVSKSSGFIQNNNGRVFQHSSGNGDPLPLTTGEMPACAADHGIVAIFKAQDKRMASTCFGRFHHLSIGGVLLAHADIFHNCGIKKKVVLGYIGNIAMIVLLRQLPYIHAA